jgi:hypothetical protein
MLSSGKTEKDIFSPNLKSYRVAYELFISSEPFPLHKFLEQWKNNGKEDVEYILAVLDVYNFLLKNQPVRDGSFHPTIKLDKEGRYYLLC